MQVGALRGSAHGAAGSHDEDVVGADVLHPRRAHDDAGVGDAHRAVGADGDVVQLHGAVGGEVDVGQRRASRPVESAQYVDVRHPQGVAVDRHPLRGIKRHAIHATLHEHDARVRVGGAHPGDVAVVVPHRAVPLHVRHEEHVLLGVIPY